MAQTEYVVALTEFEKGLMVNGLMEFHNSLIREHKSTEDVDALLKKVLYAPVRKEKRWGRSEAR